MKIHKYPLVFHVGASNTYVVTYIGDKPLVDTGDYYGFELEIEPNTNKGETK